MKFNIFYLAILMLLCFSCDEDEILKEEALDFYSTANAYVTPANYQTALNKLYGQFRDYMIKVSANDKEFYLMGTDLCINAIEVNWYLNDYTQLTPFNATASKSWDRFFKLIYDANVILSNIENAEFDAAEKNRLKAEAMFFRAIGYRFLANLYGGVPIILEEITSPRRDFVRATRTEVYQQCASDLEFAVANLLGTGVAQDGQLNNATANHLLSEIYISLERWDDAIAAASAAIDDPATALMTSRFGAKLDEPGDVFSDLFRYGNYNRASGNTEGLWVLQFDYQNNGSNNGWWHLGAFTGPEYAALTLDDGKPAYINYWHYEDMGGWSIGWLRGIYHLFEGIWQSDYNNDIRNSEYNILRTAKVRNPESAYFGMDLDPSMFSSANDTVRNWYPIHTKNSRWNDQPVELLDNVEEGIVSINAFIHKDFYFFRLAETYLLRAEAYLGKGQTGLAADDINRLRSRANASDVTPGEVDIDYILDERLRELAYEELRLFTLTRLGLLYDRTKRYNPYAKNSIKEYNNLYPIPFSQIETNTLEVLEQNPGYPN
tara:strand:- start:8364 stop:10007 length:1644 start_codon:yes stop_codon:yes gene_type:complete